MSNLLLQNKKSNLILTISLLTTTSATLLMSSTVQAVPSFSRQTGAACSQCHTQSFGPNLTPFGRDFKLGGYTMSNGKESKIPAVSGMIQGSFTHTKGDNQDQNSTPANNYNKNNNFTFDQASLFYAGKIYGKVGAFSQLSFDGSTERLALDNTDIRFADNNEFFDTPVTYGISVNNNPTAQDLWNTTSAWGFPYNGSPVMPSVGSTSVIDGAFSTQVGGATAYTMINNLLYLEAGGYASLANNMQKSLGVANAGQQQIDGAAPYWRVALQKDWKGHFVSVGHYGMSANVFPGRDKSLGATDNFTDFGFDTTYQYMANPKHIFEIKSTYIYEDQKLSYTNISNQLNPNARSYLNTFKINAAYTFDQTYGLTFGYNNIKGSNALTLNTADDGTNFYSSSKPNSEFYTAELVYVPFGKASSYASPWLNLRTSLQYIGYSQANGTTQQSTTNNTFMINGWLIF